MLSVSTQLNLDALLGEPLTLRLLEADGDYRAWHGYVTQMSWLVSAVVSPASEASRVSAPALSSLAQYVDKGAQQFTDGGAAALWADQQLLALALTEKNTPVKKVYKLKTDYQATGPNCTTLSIEGLNFSELMALKVSGGAYRLFLPANLLAYLNTQQQNKPIRIDVYGSGK